jgi:hypothetical protein
MSAILSLFENIEPAPRPLPRPRLVAAPRPVLAVPCGRTLTLPGMEVLVVPAIPAPAPTRRRRLPPREQMALPFVRTLTLHPDMLRATRGLCLAQQDECEESDCRHHLGAVRDLDGQRYGCAVAVAIGLPHGLAPVYVARLLGVTESEVQQIERRAAPKLRLALQHLANEEHEHAVRVRRERR